ncbi:MAG: hypothetical protein FWG97_02005 [Deltaproteobacteria bacterium]|nr:hypothetical protein [Deltaproteobacteria bacterium]
MALLDNSQYNTIDHNFFIAKHVCRSLCLHKIMPATIARPFLARELLKHLKYCGIFHWYTGNKILFLPLDLRWMRRYKVKKIVHWQGDDIRDPLLELELNPWYSHFTKNLCFNELKNISKANKLKQKIFFDEGFTFLAPVDLVPHLITDAQKIFIPIRHTLNTDYLIPIENKKNENRINIVHAPSEYNIKGTSYIIEAIKKLEKHFHIRFTLLSGLPHQGVLRHIAEADIFVDQLILGMYGMASLEAMAFGIPVVCRIASHIREQLPSDFPIIDATPKNIYEILASLIIDKDKLCALGDASRSYVVKYHSYAIMGRYLHSLYESLKPV